jgi:hypothetical protein
VGKDYLLYNASSDAINLDLSKTTGTFSLKVLNTEWSCFKEEKINGWKHCKN